MNYFVGSAVDLEACFAVGSVVDADSIEVDMAD